MYIWVAFGLEGGNQSSGDGWWPKSKCWRSGPNLPRGSIVKGMSNTCSGEVGHQLVCRPE